MKKKALVLAACMAFSAPSVSIAKALPDNIVGLNLGEIQSSSYLNQPFKGEIPFLFTSIEKSNQLSVTLAPSSIYGKLGAEKLPILRNLKFRIGVKNGHPVVFIHSTRPIQLPFLNIILEINGPHGSIYQDYTVLLDPQSNKAQQISSAKQLQSSVTKDVQYTLQEPLLLETYTAPISTDDSKTKYTVVSGDSLSKIAARLKPKGVSLRNMMTSVHSRNPQAFIRNDRNIIIKGAILSIPSLQEINNFQHVKIKVPNDDNKNVEQSKITEKIAFSEETYKVIKGDNLTKITHKFLHDDISFTKMMTSIHKANPHAFSRNQINLLKADSILKIPTLELVAQHNIKSISVDPKGESLETGEALENKVEKDLLAERDSIETVKLVTQDDIDKLKESVRLEKKSNLDAEIDKESQITLKENQLESVQDESLESEAEIAGETEFTQYTVQDGDTLTKVTRSIGYQDVSFSKMMKALFAANQHAFVSNNITKLKIGAVITLPTLASVQSGVQKSTKAKKSKKSDPSLSLSQVGSSGKASNQTALALQKRIRELRKDFNLSKKKVSELEKTLFSQEDLIRLKDSEIVSLKSNSIKTKIDNRLEAIPLPDGYATSDIVKSITTNTKTYSADGKPEIKDVPSLVAAIYEDAKSTKNLGYISMALILALLLLRYRREIYSYTSISASDYLRYYPKSVAASLKPEVKELIYQDTLVDPKEEEKYFSQDAEESSFEDVMPKVDFAESIETEQADSTIDIPEEHFEEMKHCDNLITELLDELKTESVISPESDWESIEKVCDNYLQSIDIDDASTEISHEEDELADFDLMMSDLLTNLNKEKERFFVSDSKSS
ncbi:MAG: FimV/HubP family polar landmark protein [Cocleimonas sp.]